MVISVKLSTVRIMDDTIRSFKESNSVSKLLDALPCGVLAITEDGKVVKLNNGIEQIFGVKNAELIGKGYGHSLRCINVYEDQDLCGSANGCADCEVRKLALRALYSSEKKRRRVALQVSINSHVKDVSFLLCASPLKFGRDRLGAHKGPMLTDQPCVLIVAMFVR